MASFSTFQNQINSNQSRIKTILLVFAIFCLISPFTGYLELHSNLISYFQNNFSSINQYPLNINPIFMLLQFLMYELNSLVEFIFPKLWGQQNYFFLRFLFKLPLFISYVLIAYLIEKIIYIEFKDEQLAIRSFYIQLFNLPLMYTTFIMGTPESLVIFFMLIQFYILLQIKNNSNSIENNYLQVFFSGFLFGIAISFSYILFLMIFIFLYALKIKQVLVYVFSVIFSNILIILPFYLSNLPSFEFYNQNYIGIQNLLVYFKIENQLIYTVIFLFEISLLIIFLNYKMKDIFNKLLVYSFIVILLTINLTLSDILILIQIFILGMLKDFDLNSEYKFKSLKIEKLPSARFYVPLGLIYLLSLLYLYFVFHISDIVYLKFIVLGSFGAINRWFWNLNILFKFNLIFYFTLSILLLCTTFLLLKKRKIFNTDEVL